MVADSTEEYASIEEIYQKFSPIFQYENIDKLTADDFQAFFKTDIKQFFTTRHKSLEHQYAGIVSKPKNFPDLKKALKILVNESKSLDERLEEIFQDDADFLSWFKSDIFSPILHVIAPNKYAIFNTRIQPILESKYNDQFDAKDWKTYEKANRMLNYDAGERNSSLYELDQQLGGQSSKPDSSYYKKLKEAIEGIQDQANYQYVMMRFLLGKKSATRDEIAEELKRWNEDKPDNFDFKRAPVFDTNIVKNFTTRIDDTFQLQHHETLNFYERHQLISLCEEKIRGRIDTHNEGTIPYSDLVFSPLTDKQEIKKVHDKVVTTLSNASSRNQEFKALEFTGEGYWLDKHGVFFFTATDGLDKRYWDIFGTEEPVWSNKWLQNHKPQIDIEINPPIEGGTWNTSAQLLKDNHGRIYYTHNGYLNVTERKNYGFRDIYAGLSLKASNYSDGEKHKPYYIISDVASPDFVDNVADFVKEVHDFKKFAKSPEYQALGEEEPTEYWMIRAGGEIKSKGLSAGWDWENQREKKIAAIHYYDVDLSKCTEGDGILSEEKVKEKVDKIRKDRGDTELTPGEWVADYEQLEKIFSVNRTGGKCRILVVGKNKDLLGFGDATSQYEYKKGLPNPHAINVEWIDTNKRELSKASGFNRSIKEIKTKEEYDLLMGQKFFLLRHNVDGPWKDDLGKAYHFGKTVANHLKLRGAGVGTKTIWFTVSDKNYYFWGYGAFKEIQTEVEDEKWKLIYDDFKFFKDNLVDIQGRKLKRGSESIKRQIQALPKFNQNTSMFEIPRSLYREITGEVLIDDDQLSDTLNLDPYIEAINWIPNLILYGPPGTGKTYHAKEIAEKLTDQKYIYNVTFHPSYSYEDFLEGYRPKTESYTEISENEYSINDGKYKKLGDYLRNSGEQEITLTFPEIEKIIDSELPHSAGNYKAWWGNEAPKDGGQPQRAIWMAAGYKVKRGSVSTVPSDDNKVTFTLLNERPFEKIGIQNNSSSPYVLETGIFKRACDDAKNNEDKKIVVIIDEINRGNIPKIFGELISLIEKDKRGPNNPLQLVYSKKNFFVPDNLYIIGTMNTADKSLVQMDEALRRRFAFEELMPNPELLDDRPARKYKDILEKLNKKIVDTDERMKQYRDKQVGHSYFWDIKNDNELRLVIKYQIIPLLQDYFYDDYAEIKRILGDEIIGKDNRQSDLLDKGNEAKLKDALLKALNPSKKTEQGKSKDTEQEEDDDNE